MSPDPQAAPLTALTALTAPTAVTPLTARILAVGTELLGDKQDLNGPHLARLLRSRGCRVESITLAGDHRAALASEIRHALRSPGLVVIAGGLGPTDDDLTREALSDATGVAIEEDAEARARIEDFLARRGREPNAFSLRQALRPAGSEAIPNVTGMAVGAVLAVGPSVVVLLPGPPGEMIPMAEGALHRAERLLRERGLLPAAVPHRSVLVLAGIGEGDAALAVANLPELREVDVAWLAHPGEVRLVLSHADAARVRAASAAARAALGRDVVSTDGRSLAEVVLATLIEREETIAPAESCTGGLLAAALTAIPGSSKALRAGFVTYSNEAKTEALGVPEHLFGPDAPGAVSNEVASAMALGVRRAGRSDWGVGITGIAGPDGGTETKPVGLVHWAVARPDGRVEAWSAIFGGSRDDVRRRAVAAALDAVRRCS